MYINPDICYKNSGYYMILRIFWLISLEDFYFLAYKKLIWAGRILPRVVNQVNYSWKNLPRVVNQVKYSWKI